MFVGLNFSELIFSFNLSPLCPQAHNEDLTARETCKARFSGLQGTDLPQNPGEMLLKGLGSSVESMKRLGGHVDGKARHGVGRLDSAKSCHL